MRSFRPLAFKLAAICGSLFLFIVVVEFSARAASRNWTGSFLEREVDLMKSAYPVAHDAQAGWIPRRGFAGNDNIWRTQVTILPDGTRSNGGVIPAAGRGILALGDSFTFGDGVSDAGTWPAHLERLLARPVCNAGVFGYGVDQMVIRARTLVPVKNPEWLLLSFIPDDIDRCELTMRGARKPCYRLVNGALKIEQQPVPGPQPLPLDPLRRCLGQSWIAHMAIKRIAPGWWFRGAGAEIKIHDDGEAIVIALLRELADDLSRRGIRLLIVAQGDVRLLPEDQARVARIMAALRGSSALTLDLHPALSELRATDEERFKSFFRVHMTAKGNQYVAGRIADAIRSSNH